MHSCFFHRHPRCKAVSTPKTNVTFWKKKFQANVARDRKVRAELKRLGWRVVVVWECARQSSGGPSGGRHGEGG
jgi:DNA mismatch endonuclease (patch repair protein)